MAEVAVDAETGEVRVRKLTGVYDVGTVLNPMGMAGQLAGGLIQSLGAAVMEDVGLSDDGPVRICSLPVTAEKVYQALRERQASLT